MFTNIAKHCKHNPRIYQLCFTVTLGSYGSLSQNLTEEEEQQNRQIKLILNCKWKLQQVSVSCKIYNNNVCQKKKKNQFQQYRKINTMPNKIK